MKTNMKLTLATVLIVGLFTQQAEAVVTKKQIVATVTLAATILGTGYYLWQKYTIPQVDTQTPDERNKRLEAVEKRTLTTPEAPPVAIKKDETPTTAKTVKKVTFQNQSISGLQFNPNDLKNSTLFQKKTSSFTLTPSPQSQPQTINKVEELTAKIETWILESNRNSSFITKIEKEFKNMDPKELVSVLEYKNKKNQQLKNIAKNTGAHSTIEKAYKDNKIQ